MNSEGGLNRDSLVKGYLQRLLSKDEILTDSEFYYLLKYSGRYGLTPERSIYRKLLKDAGKSGFAAEYMRSNLRNFNWVLDVCKSIINK